MSRGTAHDTAADDDQDDELHAPGPALLDAAQLQLRTAVEQLLTAEHHHLNRGDADPALDDMLTKRADAAGIPDEELPGALADELAVPHDRLAAEIGMDHPAGDLAALARAGTAALLVGGGAIALSLLLPARSIGLGDAKLLVSIAPTLAWLGWSELVVGIWLGFVLGGIVALALLLTRRAGRRTSLAFGPHLVAGAVLALALA